MYLVPCVPPGLNGLMAYSGNRYLFMKRKNFFKKKFAILGNIKGIPHGKLENF